MATRRTGLRRAGQTVERTVRRIWRRHVVPPFHDLRYGRMPVAMITGSLGKTTTSRLLATILEKQGHRVGLTSTAGIFVDGKCVQAGDSSGYSAARQLLRDFDITAAVLETARGDLIKQGPFMKRGKVGALLNVESEHIGLDGIATLDDMARLKARVVRGSRLAIINADDARCAKVAETIKPRRLIMFSLSNDAPALRRAVAGGGRAVTCDAEGWMVLMEGGRSIERLVRIVDVPLTLGGIAEHYTANAMAAAALATALDVPPETVREGLIHFRGGRADNPGRWNVFEGYSFTFVAERGMNGAAFAGTAKVVAALSGPGRRLALLTAAGNRTEGQYDELAAVAARAFDRFVIYDNAAYRRGRAPGEVPALLAAALERNGVSAECVECAADVEMGLARISAIVKPGDFVLMLQNQLPELAPVIEEALAHHRLG